MPARSARCEPLAEGRLEDVYKRQVPRSAADLSSKNDRNDAARMAKAILSHDISPVWVPSPEIEGLRAVSYTHLISVGKNNIRKVETMFTDKPESYRGVYSLLLTPFKEDKSIDYDVYAHLTLSSGVSVVISELPQTENR